MAKKQVIKVKPEYTCRQCQHSYDWHEKDWKGELFMCRCKHDEKSKFGKFCKFLSDPQCANFVKRA